MTEPMYLIKIKRFKLENYIVPESLEMQAYRNGFDEGFEIGKAQCETHHQEIKEEAAAQAREDVLKEIIPALGRAIQTDISDNQYVMIEDLESTLESLRHGQSAANNCLRPMKRYIY